jgi:ribosomal protein L10
VGNQKMNRIELKQLESLREKLCKQYSELEIKVMRNRLLEDKLTTLRFEIIRLNRDIRLLKDEWKRVTD